MYLKTIALLFFSLICVSNTLASGADLSCPPASVVKANATFTRTQATILPTLKQIFTNSYQYADREWVTMFIFGMDISNNDDTLNYGQKLFNKANLSEHSQMIKSLSRLTCTYQTDKGVIVETSTRLS